MCLLFIWRPDNALVGEGLKPVSGVFEGSVGTDGSQSKNCFGGRRGVLRACRGRFRPGRLGNRGVDDFPVRVGEFSERVFVDAAVISEDEFAGQVVFVYDEGIEAVLVGGACSAVLSTDGNVRHAASDAVGIEPYRVTEEGEFLFNEEEY